MNQSFIQFSNVGNIKVTYLKIKIVIVELFYNKNNLKLGFIS